MGVVIAWSLAIVGTLIILKIVDATIGLRVAEEQKHRGSIFHSTARKATTGRPRLRSRISRKFVVDVCTQKNRDEQR